MRLSFEFNNYKVEYNVTFRKRVGVAIHVAEDGEVNVVAPIGISVASVKDIVIAKAQFIMQQLAQIQPSQKQNSEQQDFLQCMYLGKNYTIEQVENEQLEDTSVKLTRGKFLIEAGQLTNTVAKEALSKWFITKTVAKTKERLKVYGEVFENLPKKIEAGILPNRRWEIKDKTLIIDINTLIGPVFILDSILLEALSNFNKDITKEQMIEQFGEIIEETNNWIKENPKATQFF
jgi:predicted metal-dependent hydrolase